MKLTEMVAKMGKLLSSKRERDHKTLREVAVDIGVSYGTVSRIEHSRPFSSETMVLLITWLYGDEVPDVKEPK